MPVWLCKRCEVFLGESNIIQGPLNIYSVLEFAVVGPPDLYRTGFTSVGPLATMAMAWIRSENNLTHLLPICFAANTKRSADALLNVYLYICIYVLQMKRSDLHVLSCQITVGAKMCVAVPK